MKKYLSEFIDSIEYSLASDSDISKIEIDSLVFDSRHVKPGALFFALPGTHTTGNRFIASAIGNGAAAVVFEGDLSDSEKSDIERSRDGRDVA